MIVYKFPLHTVHSYVEMPVDAQVLSVQVQRGVPCAWVLLDQYAPRAPHLFALIATGEEIPGGLEEHAGTVLCNDGSRVWHVFYGVKTW